VTHARLTADPSFVPDSQVPATLVRAQDRTVDAAAALLLAGGIALFAFGRRALTAIAEGNYPAPMGETWVARTDFHTAQTRWGLLLIAVGVSVAVVSALRHALHRHALHRHALRRRAGAR